MPALARCAAIRDPIVPAPSTAVFRTSSGTPFLLTSDSAIPLLLHASPAPEAKPPVSRRTYCAMMVPSSVGPEGSYQLAMP